MDGGDIFLAIHFDRHFVVALLRHPAIKLPGFGRIGVPMPVEPALAH